MKINTEQAIMIIGMVVMTTSLYCRMPTYTAQEAPHIYATYLPQQSKNQSNIINVVEGQSFTITLDCQTATGYTWYITQPVIEEYIQLLGKTVMPYRCPGGRGKAIFRFKALNAGRETIKFEYARPWGWQAAKQCTYTIFIRPKAALYERIHK